MIFEKGEQVDSKSAQRRADLMVKPPFLKLNILGCPVSGSGWGSFNSYKRPTNAKRREIS